MRSNIYLARNAAWVERQRQILAAGLVSERFPGVLSIVVTMNYNRGRNSALLRTLNFYPESPAFFKVSPLGEGGEDGAPDLTNFISRMIGAHQRSAQGGIGAGRGDEVILHPQVDYQVAITYCG
ncbi:MAG TPA: hypothetical protein VN317_10560 [Candidatus Methanoperedens sp.]|nr:hypothetical protein [Candidatus Methanoperedens sp.]